MSARIRLPLPPLRRYSLRDLPADLTAALAVCFLAVPQGLAYATIAGLPPVMGLYAAAVPTIVGSLFRSSRHVIAGPTNALSLLVGAAVATGLGGDPATVALTLALMVGVLQVLAGLLRLGAVADYISGPVILGYITGAGVLIGAGQLYNVIGTAGPRGTLVATIDGWLGTVGDLSGLAIGVAAGTIVVVVAMRTLGEKVGRRIPGAIVALTGALVLNLALGLEDRGLAVIADLSPIPAGFAGPAWPPLADLAALAPVAVACTVLSLVESSAVARSIGARRGQRIDASTEFVGQGLSNLAAGLWGGYPVSGSLARSALNERSGARTRVAGVLTGTMMIGVLMAVGSLLDHVPIASLAGLLMVVAWDLVDVPRIIRTMRASRADAWAFCVTLAATWTLSLDWAIYLGVAVSVTSFLRRARLLVLREMIVDSAGRWQERSLGDPASDGRIAGVRVIQIEGPMFFGATGELSSHLDALLRRPGVHAVVLRLKRAQGMDATAAHALAETARLARSRGKRLLLVGLSAAMEGVMKRSGAVEAFDDGHVMLASPQRFKALGPACDKARQFAEHAAQAAPNGADSRSAAP